MLSTGHVCPAFAVITTYQKWDLGARTESTLLTILPIFQHTSKVNISDNNVDFY
jgi:hypothetical protein